MDNCLQSLEGSPEWYGDRVLALQARCCLITESLNRLAQPLSLFSNGLFVDSLSAPARQQQKSTYVAALELQLAEIKNKILAYGLENNSELSRMHFCKS